jgi:DNA-binding response OmpR family regulator
MRLLVVEDEQRLAAGLRKGSGRRFAVDVVHNGTDGIWMARENPFDAIILDVMLPAPTGTRCAGRAPRAIDSHPDADREGRRLGRGRRSGHRCRRLPDSRLACGADRTAAALRRRGARARPTVLEAGDLRLDPAMRRVWLRGEQIELTRREFAILEYLLHHPDEVMSKRDILDHVWDFDFDGDPNIVEVYVRRLRIKLPRPGDGTLIETVRGAGYRLVVARD